MASNISTYSINIDETFPVAGVDNESQGFRDNFDLIKTALTVASSEVTDLQDTTAKINAANNFSGNAINNADLVAVTEKMLTRSDFAGGDISVQFLTGHYQIFTISGDSNIVLDWSVAASTTLTTGRLAKMYIQVSSSAGTNNLTFVSAGDTVYYKNGSAEPFSIDSDFHLFEVWKPGTNTYVFVNYLGKFVS